MPLAVLCPGQGLALAGAAAPWYEASPVVRALLEQAAHEVRLPANKLLQANGLALRTTATYQPVLTALCAGILAEVEARAGAPDVALGHSLGELPACVAAGILRSSDAVTVSAVRGRLMAREAARHPGAMAALKVSVAQAMAIVDEASAHGFIAIAAYNAADQQVVSGDPAVLRMIPAWAVPQALDTDGAWHCAAMQDAQEEFAATLAPLVRAPSRVQWVANRTGEPMRDPAAIVEALALQLTHPVQWTHSLETLVRLGVTTIVTVGPTRGMRTLARRTLGDSIRLIPMETPEDLMQLATAAPA